ncbi:mandelate racemase/muconate lactonizing enzyme family protein [Phycisphaerales bacterium AB-hyl4]|uniref:glucarate dehydratase n=1 Tax=Natronomicrosphaera hydrolytica TaxID=3242702 RepID=A0ABV4U4D8_9BACT
MSKSNVIRRIIVHEVKVPAKEGAVNHPSVDHPLHKITVAGQAAWSVQFDALSKVMLELELDSGIVGLGECYRDHAPATIDNIARSLIGQDILTLNRQQLPIGHCREYDGFECAITDAYAKLHDLRVADLLGGPVRDRVKVGAWTGHRTVDEMGPMAQRFAKQGFDNWKLKCGLDDDVVGWCERVAEASPGMTVTLDPNERWERADEARSRIARLAEVGNVLCLEDPIPRWMLAEYAELRKLSPIRIVLHVSLPYIVHGQRVSDAVLALQHRAVDGFNFNGGLAGFAQLDRIAAAANLPCWHGSEVDLGILEAMYVHQAAAAVSCTWPSDIFGRMVREHDLLKQPLRIEPPHVYLPEGPGLGVALDEDAVKAHALDRKVYE